jgi:UDP-sulfoquinovose synthase
MRILVLGGDGFCGWPTALHLSKRGHEIVIVDNLSHRNIDNELECGSLTPIQPMSTRLVVWKDLTGQEIRFVSLNVAKEYERWAQLLVRERPHAVIHFAEQSSAPYSMKSPRHKMYTIDNNLNATNNVLSAIAESGLDAHVVHLGTMGVYGYGTLGAKIPEGYVNVRLPGGVDARIMYPPNPDSIYHLTKTQDALLFQFYAKNDRLRITDLHQGIVWGTATPETVLDERLINRFNYDGDYGTVLNRFVMQAALGYPLTVYGNGGQKRAFIHLRDTVRCIELALANPPKEGDGVEIFNQMTETHRVADLARLVAKMTGAQALSIPNPRAEAAQNEFEADNSKFLALGLNPTRLSAGLMEEVKEIARRYVDRCDPSKILPTSYWRKELGHGGHGRTSLNTWTRA